MSQMLLAVPMMLLYEGALLLARGMKPVKPLEVKTD
jgi:Sec-independent protein secretion pathway component TatC